MLEMLWQGMIPSVSGMTGASNTSARQGQAGQTSSQLSSANKADMGSANASVTIDRAIWFIQSVGATDIVSIWCTKKVGLSRCLLTISHASSGLPLEGGIKRSFYRIHSRFHSHLYILAQEAACRDCRSASNQLSHSTQPSDGQRFRSAEPGTGQEFERLHPNS